MQMCYSPRCKLIDMSTADQLILIFRNNAETSLSTFRSNPATLKYEWTFFRGIGDLVSKESETLK